MSNSIKKCETIVTIINQLGLHARPAALLVKTSNSFKSDIFLVKTKDGETVNAKSIMGVMMLAAAQGTRLKITAEGEDCEEAVKAIEDIINKKFGED